MPNGSGFFGSSEIIATEIDRVLVDLQEAHRRNVVDLSELVVLALEELPESKPTAAA